MDKLKILVVEDEALARAVMARRLKAHSVVFAEDLKAGRRALDAGHYDLCFFDLQLGRKDECSGLKLIPMAVEKGIYSVVMTSRDSEEMANKAYELGCNDFYAKGAEEANVGAVIAKYLRSRSGFDADRIFTHQFVTDDAATRAGITEALKHAASDLPILILGPSGTGKTSLGKIIHDQSAREGEFVAINCSAYSEDLLEAELFGYKKGAFTGAVANRKGKLLQADKGTLFLDEIGAMSLNMQAKLLKAIEERSFYPVGEDKPERSEFRLISATLEDLQRLITAGRLRFDFFQRIHGLTVTLKPLAERKEDVFTLIKFLTRGGKRLSFTEDAKTCLRNHSWPGNVRELKKVVDLLSAETEGRVTAEQVRRHLTQAIIEPGAISGSFVDENQYRYALHGGLDRALDRFADEIIRRNLAENGGRKTKTMSALEISSRRLYATLSKTPADEEGER